MTSLSAFLAPIAMLLPGPGPAVYVHLKGELAPREASAGQVTEIGRPGWLMAEAMEQIAINRQIRIERRITIRIAPAASTDARSMVADLPRGEIPANMVERKFGKCVAMGSISGVQPTRDNRLMLYLRDRRIISASLEKACSARDFYSGFYVEKNADGMLCTGRDKLHSRTGANCEVDRMRQLVAR